MSSTIFPVEEKNYNKVGIKKLETEIEALRCSTQQAMQQSLIDANRIKHDIYNEVQKRDSFSIQIRQLNTSSLGHAETDDLNKIIELISSNISDRSMCDVTQDSSHFSSCSLTYSFTGPRNLHASSGSSGMMGKQRRSFRDLLELGGEVCTTLAGSFIQRRREKLLFNEQLASSSSWHGFTNIFEDNKKIQNKTTEAFSASKSKSAGFLNELGTSNYNHSMDEKKNIEKELINEIQNFEQLSLDTISALEEVLREKEEMLLELELKVKSQQSQLNRILEALERTKIVLRDSNLEVDFPGIQQK